jgi:hypothetical protein
VRVALLLGGGGAYTLVGCTQGKEAHNLLTDVLEKLPNGQARQYRRGADRSTQAEGERGQEESKSIFQ